MRGCRDLIQVPKSFSGLGSLETVHFDFCTKLKKLPEDIGSLPWLQTLGLDSLRCEFSCLSGLSSLRILSLNYCNLMEEEKLNDIFCLSSLEQLELKGNRFSSIPADISKLLRLRILDLSHCENLLQIPELPPSLRRLDAHGSPAILSGPSSLLKCFKSLIQEMKCRSRLNEEESFTDISFVPGISGIPDWVKCHLVGSQTGIRLPQNWYLDDHLLGIVVGCVYSLVDDESGHMSEDVSDSSENEVEVEEFQEKSAHISLNCDFTIKGYGLEDEASTSVTNDCECYKDAKDHKEASSDETWVVYYPKAAIPHKFHCNQLSYFLASFAVSDRGKPLKVKKSSIDFVYDSSHGQSRDHGVHSCSDCQSDRKHELKLCLEGSDFNELPTIIIESLSVDLETLCLRNCQNLECLPSNIFCKLKSLEGLFCSGCSNLKSFPDIMKGMVVNLRKLYLDETAIEELPSSVEHLRALQELRLHSCDNLTSLPESLCNLTSLTDLDVRWCSQLTKLPENLGNLQNLEELYAANLDSISNFQLPCFSGLRSLRILDLQLINLNQGAIPSDICCLYSLKVLVLSNCNLIEGGIPSEIYDLSLLQALYLDGNHFTSIPAGINKLSGLRLLNLNHCQKLLQIPELPSSLRFLDIHGCASLETLSSPSPSTPLPSCLFNCFKSTIQDSKSGIIIPIESYVDGVSNSNHQLQILVSSSGLINGGEWTRYQNEGCKVSRKLPRNWHKNDDLLGFAVCSLHVPTDHDEESEDDDDTPDKESVDDTWSLKCELTVENDHLLKLVVPFSCETCCNCGIDDVSSQKAWVIYVPKITVSSEDANNKWRLLLKAAFQGYFNGQPVKVENCGIHLIYAHQQEEP